eukprot:2613177-Alexandrium_andersonii.AAC.1
MLRGPLQLHGRLGLLALVAVISLFQVLCRALQRYPAAPPDGKAARVRLPPGGGLQPLHY